MTRPPPAHPRNERSIHPDRETLELLELLRALGAIPVEVEARHRLWRAGATLLRHVTGQDDDAAAGDPRADHAAARHALDELAAVIEILKGRGQITREWEEEFGRQRERVVGG